MREDTRELVDRQDVTQSLLRLMKLQVPELSQICILVSPSVAFGRGARLLLVYAHSYGRAS